MIEGHPRHLAADRVEATQNDRLRCVVDDQVDPGRVFEGSNVAALPTDDAPLHLVAGDCHHRQRGLGGLLGGNPLHRGYQDVARALFAFLFDDLFAIADLLRDLLIEFLFKVGEDRRPRFGPRHSRNPLELFDLLGESVIDAFSGPPDFQLFLRDPLFLSVEIFELAIDRFFFLLNPAFRTLELSTCVAYLLFQAQADAVGFLFGLEDHLLHLGLGVRQQLFPLRVGDEIPLRPRTGACSASTSASTVSRAGPAVASSTPLARNSWAISACPRPLVRRRTSAAAYSRSLRYPSPSARSSAASTAAST